MQCPECRFDNPPQVKFCGQCGTRLRLLCPGCGVEAGPGFQFCGHCGRRLDSPSAAPIQPASSPSPAGPPAESPPRDAEAESEIKHVTVLLCELVRTPADALGPERMHTLLSRFFELAQAEIQRFGGTIHQFLGQGFMALFGAPRAYEDHARRGLLSALALRERLAERTDETQDHVPWAVRIGLDTGPVVVGGVGGMVVGETTTVAGRLQQLAAPGDVLISGNTARLVRDLAELEIVEATSGGDAVETFRVGETLPALAALSPFREGQLSPFVGRRRELAILDELRQQAASGHGQVVGISGEAGSGKSRLLYEFYRRTFPGRQVSYLRCQCLSYGSTIPYLPLVDMIRKSCRISEADSAAQTAAKLRHSMELVGTDPAAALPYFLRLLGVEEGTEPLAELEPQAIQTRTFATLRRMLLDASQRNLVVVELEDVHWIDETSKAFLASLVEVMGAARLMLLLTYRSGYQPPRWLEKSYATQITMHRLSEDDSRLLVGALLQRGELPETLAGEILAKAEGNPLFLEELARSLIEHGTSREALIPDTVQGILMARIDRLPEGHKHLLKSASVLGREFSVELLSALWDRRESPQPLLQDLRGWELLYEAPAEDRAICFFKHALTQEVAYESLLTERRRELHQRAAEVLEALHAEHPEEAYDQLIYHYPRAGDPEKTVHYLTLFAARAARSYAHAEAAKALSEALPHVELLPAESRDRRLVEVLLQLADSLLPLARFPETLELFARHAERAEKLGDPSLSAQYQFWLAHTHTYLGHQEETKRHAELSIAAARECGDEATEGKACYVLGRDGFWSGRFSAGIESSLRAVVLLERSGEPWWQGQAYWVAGFNHYVLGDFEKGIDSLERARAIGEALDDYRLDTSWSLGYFYASVGEWETGIEQCQKGLERSRDPLNTAVAMGFLGHGYLEKGDLPQAIETLRDSVERLRGTGMQQILGWFSAFLGEAYLLSGQLAEAQDFAAQGLEISREAGFWYGAGLAQRALGRVARRDGGLEESSQRLGEALETFTALEVPLEVGRTRLDLAALAHAHGDADAAAREISEALETFSRLDVPIYVERARKLADELSLPIPELPSAS